MGQHGQGKVGLERERERMGKELRMHKCRHMNKNKHTGTAESILDRAADMCEDQRKGPPCGKVHSDPQRKPQKAGRSDSESCSPPGPQRTGNTCACSPPGERDSTATYRQNADLREDVGTAE